MAKEGFKWQESVLIGDALDTYKDEVKQLMKKADKLGLKEAATLKQTFLDIETFRDKLSKQA